MNKGKSNKPQESVLVPVLAILTLLALCICGISPVLEELKKGKAYTLEVIFANATKVSKIDSPVEFWMNIGWQVFGFGIGIVLVIWNILDICAKKKKDGYYRKK